MQGNPAPRTSLPEREPPPAARKGRIIRPFGHWPVALASLMGLVVGVLGMDLWLESQPAVVPQPAPASVAAVPTVPSLPTVRPGILRSSRVESLCPI